MNIRHLVAVVVAACGLVAGGGFALTSAQGVALVPVAHKTTASTANAAVVNDQLQKLLAEESMLSAQIATVRQQLTQAAASEQAKITVADQALSSREAQLARQENSLAAQESNLRQATARLSTLGSSGAPSSSSYGDGGGGGGDD